MPKFIVIKGPLKDKIIDLHLDNGTVFCGRNPRMNDISILDIAVSRKHFKMFKIGGNIFVEDLKSKHGTMINGKFINPGEGFQVEEGDLITIGNTVMRLIEVSERGPMVRLESIPQKTKKKTGLNGQPDHELRSAKELELIYQISVLFKKRLNIRDFFKNVLDILFEALPRIDNGVFFIFRDEKIQDMEVIAKSREKSVARYSQKVVERVIRDRKTLRMSNTDFESPDDYIDKSDNLTIGSIMCVPIISGNEILGAIYIDSKESYGFRKGDQLLLNILAAPMATAIEKDFLDSAPDTD